MFDGEFYTHETNGLTFEATTTPPFSRTIPADGRYKGAHFISRWIHDLEDAGNFTIQFNYSYEDHRSLVNHRVDGIELDFQHNLLAGESHEIVWGLGYRLLMDRTRSGRTQIFPRSMDLHMFSAFAQDTITLSDQVRITAGTKLEHNHFSGFECQPSIRVSWAPNAKNTLWAGVSRAVQTPSRLDRGMLLEGIFAIPAPPPMGTAIVNLVGSEKTDSSDLMAFEIGYRVKPHSTLTIELATFFNLYDDVTEVSFGTPSFGFYQGQPTLLIPSIIENMGDGDSYGAELNLRWRPEDWLQFNAFYSVIDINLSGPDASNLTPHHTAHFRASVDPLEELQINTALYYTDNVPLTDIPSYLRWDLNVQWQISETLRAAVGVQNILDDRHPEVQPNSTPVWEVTRLFWLSMEARF